MEVRLSSSGSIGIDIIKDYLIAFQYRLKTNGVKFDHRGKFVSLVGDVYYNSEIATGNLRE